jgi:arylsulfatase
VLLAALPGPWWACTGEEPGPEAPAQRVELTAEAAALRRTSGRWLARARELRERAAGFEAAAALRALPESPVNGPVFRFDEHLAEARVEARPADPIGAPDAGLRFEFEVDEPDGLLPVQSAANRADGVLSLRHRREAYLASAAALVLEPDAIGLIELRLKVARGRRAVLGWSPLGPGERPLEWRALVSRSRTLTLDLVPDGRFHTYHVDARTALRQDREPGAAIRSIFLRPSDVDGDPVELDYVRLLPKSLAYARELAGTGHETLAGEMRSVLHVRSPAALSWEVDVPSRDPQLAFGTGLLDAARPVRFSVDLRADGESRELHAARVDRADRWQDVRLDLAPFAGRRVEITLRAESDGGSVALWSSPVLHGSPPERLHVIVLLEDALRADRLSAYGHGRDTSPARQRLARRGVLFERAYAQATKTRPSCPSFMTGLLPSATGVWDHTFRLDERFLTLAEVLRSQGFETVAFLQNANAGHAAGLHQGFDALFDPASLGEGPEVFGAGVSDWIEAHDERNLFVYLHAIDPHGVYDPPEPFRAWYRDQGPGTTRVSVDRVRFDPPWVAAPTAEGRRLLYDGEIRHNDLHLGAFLERLEERGILDRALVVAIADHGEHLGEHGRFGHNAPGYVQVLHVPMIWLQPGRLPAGRRVSAPVQLLDLMPTLLELAGIPSAGLLLQGDSLVPLMREEGDAALAERVVVSEEPTRFGDRERPRRSASVFWRDLHVLHSAALDGPRVFDLARDPAETEPLADAPRSAALEREVAAFLDALVAADLGIRRAIVGPGDEVIGVDAQAREQLRALGYVE